MINTLKDILVTAYDAVKWNSAIGVDKMKDDPVWTKVTSYIIVIAFIIFAGSVAQYLIDHNDNFQQRSPYLTATGATLLMCLYVSVVFAANLMIKKEESHCLRSAFKEICVS